MPKRFREGSMRENTSIPVWFPFNCCGNGSGICVSTNRHASGSLTPEHRILMSRGVKDDLNEWLVFPQRLNGKAVVYWVQNSDL